LPSNTTLSGHNYLKMMLDAQQLGFDVILIYVGTTSSDINVARVNNRVLLGGHDVPEEDIRRRYERSLANLPLAVSRSDFALLFDNSTTNGFRFVAHFDHGTAQWFQDAPLWAAALPRAK
jgi:predicted ABC-type ATPase